MDSKESLRLGEFVGGHGKDDCLVVCRIFGLTGCEWNSVSGECYAHMKEISIGTRPKISFCYKFNNNPAVGKTANNSNSIDDYEEYFQTVPGPSSASL